MRVAVFCVNTYPNVPTAEDLMLGDKKTHPMEVGPAPSLVRPVPADWGRELTTIMGISLARLTWLLPLLSAHSEFIIIVAPCYPGGYSESTSLGRGFAFPTILREFTEYLVCRHGILDIMASVSISSGCYNKFS